ncbi:hypothetical protein ACVWW2_007761 [Bradyrhizobium sp. LM4.3]
MSISGAANTTAPILPRHRVAVASIELTQAFERQHGSHAVRNDVHAAGAWSRHQRREHALEIVAGPHRAVAVIGIIEQPCLGRPGKHHGPAAELDPVGEMGGIEHRRLECLLEAVHIDQHVAAAGLRHKIANVDRYRFDPVEAPIAKSNRGERKSALVRRHQLRPCDRHGGRALRAEPGFRASAVRGLACGGDEQGWINGER